MSVIPDVSGSAALTIVESLLLSLNDRGVLPKAEILGILRDAANAHENMPASLDETGHHAAVAALIKQILVGGDSLRSR